MTSVRSICGVAKLLSAIGFTSEDAIYKTLGLTKPKRGYECSKCHRPTTYRSSRLKGQLCRQCRHEESQIKVACEYCGKLTEMYASEFLWDIQKRGQQHFFCSHPCQQKYLWANHMTNMKPVGRKPIFDHEAIKQMHNETGYTGEKLAQIFGCSDTLVYQILKGSV